MGGLIGMALASFADTPVRRLLLNDIGPVLDPGALARIGEYIGQDLRFPSYEAGKAYVRAISATFGPHGEDEWDKLARDVLVQTENGQWATHYDRGLAQPFAALTPEQVARDQDALWAAYDAIRCPTLLVRGAESDLLSHATALEMCARGPHPRLVELPGVGHAPTFVQADQIAIAREFLTG
jgi:pimeloyl-ACP methyl ester carboxylesterase